MSKLKLLVADSAALANSTAATVMTKSDASTYELVYSAGSLPVDSSRGFILRLRAAVHATSTTSTDTLACVLQTGKTGTMTTVAATAAVDATNDDVFFLEADLVFRTASTFYSAGRGQYTALTAPQLTFTRATTYDPASDFRAQVKCTWSAASASDSCKVVFLSGEIIQLDPNATAALS